MVNRVGQQLGNYHLIRLLGQGNFSEVYLGEHVYLKTQAAIKVLQTQLVSDEMEGFLSETRNIARLKHPHIVKVLEFGVENATPFLVTSYAPQGSMRQLCSKGMRLPLESIMFYVKQVADALQYAHDRELLHRDIKPENMLLGQHNELLLSDFGTTLLIQSLHYQNTHGTGDAVLYMAPEQLRGKPSPASDQYALAIVIYEWLSGDCPFHGSFSEVIGQHLSASPPPLQGNVSPDIGRVVLTALEKDPQHRFTNVAAFARSLEQACMPILAIQHSDSAFPSSLSKRQMDETLPPSMEHHSRHNPQSAALVQSFPVRQGLQQYQKPSVRMVLLLIIVVLLVAGGSGLIFYSKVFLPATFDAQTTATAEFDATITAMTPQDIYTYATRGSPIIHDSLSDQSNSTWKNESHPVGNCNFTSEAYHVKVVVVNNFLACLSKNSNFRNFAFQVQMTIIKGDAGGIIFRTASGNSQFYYFYIYADGHYIFALGTSSALLSGENSSTSLLKAGYNQANLITAVAHGSDFYIYVNKQYVTHMSDSTLSAGAIGLFVRDDANAYTEVAFGNAQVWKL